MGEKEAAGGKAEEGDEWRAVVGKRSEQEERAEDKRSDQVALVGDPVGYRPPPPPAPEPQQATNQTRSRNTAVIVRRVSSTLNLLSGWGMAFVSSAEAAAVKDSSVAGAPSRYSSALVARHGWVATPPSARWI